MSQLFNRHRILRYTNTIVIYVYLRIFYDIISKKYCSGFEYHNFISTKKASHKNNELA